MSVALQQLEFADPFLVLELCNTNKEIFNYISNNPSFIETIIHNLIEPKHDISKEAILTVLTKILNKTDSSLNLVLLQHLLDYETFRINNPKMFEDKPFHFREYNEERNYSFIEFYYLFCGTKERIIFFWDYFKKNLTYCDWKDDDYIDVIYSTIECFVKASENPNENREIKDTLFEMFSIEERSLATFFAKPERE